MDDLDAAKREFAAFLKAGGRTMVCMDPIGCGRNVPKMLELAESFRGRGISPLGSAHISAIRSRRAATKKKRSLPCRIIRRLFG